MQGFQAVFSHVAEQLVHDSISVSTEVLLLTVLVITGVIVLNGASIFATKKREASGMSKSSSTISIEGSKMLPEREFVSVSQGLAGRPDAIILENGFVIPVERKPLAKKIRDRYVAQLLVYMRLIEEFEGKKPPYGYLILGPNCRRVRIDNTPARQQWLQAMLDEMQQILRGAPAKPTPHPAKCQRCDVKHACRYAAGEIRGQRASG